MVQIELIPHERVWSKDDRLFLREKGAIDLSRQKPALPRIFINQLESSMAVQDCSTNENDGF